MKKNKLFQYSFSSVGKRISLLFIFLAVAAISFSQVPGYMGKRFTVGYSFGCMPAVHTNYDPAYTSPFRIRGLNITHSVNLNYMVAPRHEMLFGVNYSNAKFRGIYDGTLLSSKLLNEDLSMVYFSVGLKTYRRHWLIPPLGGYIKCEALYYITSVNYKSYESNGSDTPGGSLRFSSVGCAFGFGKQRIFFNRVVLDYGVRTALVVPVYAQRAHDGTQNSIISDAASKNLAHELLMVRIGLGFLAF